jgi:hypothetical protein
MEVYVAQFPGAAVKRQVSIDGGARSARPTSSSSIAACGNYVDAMHHQGYSLRMPLPDTHSADLRKRLEAHQRRIRVLRTQLRSLQQELAMHEALVTLGQNDALRAALGQLYDDADHRARFARDPVAYFREHSISLSQGVELRSLDGSDSRKLSVSVCVGDWEVQVLWDPEVGFDARPIKGDRQDVAHIGRSAMLR